MDRRNFISSSLAASACRLLLLVIYLLRQALLRTNLRRSTWICAGTIWQVDRA
jgi:hypothetical protein